MNEDRMAAIAKRAANRQKRAVARKNRQITREVKAGVIQPPSPPLGSPPFPNGFRPQVPNPMAKTRIAAPSVQKRGGCGCGKKADMFKAKMAQAKVMNLPPQQRPQTAPTRPVMPPARPSRPSEIRKA